MKLPIPLLRLAGKALLLLLLVILGMWAWEGWVTVVAAGITGSVASVGTAGSTAVWGVAALFTLVMLRAFPPAAARCGLMVLGVSLVLLIQCLLDGFWKAPEGDGNFFALHLLYAVESLLVLVVLIARAEWLRHRAEKAYQPEPGIRFSGSFEPWLCAAAFPMLGMIPVLAVLLVVGLLCVAVGIPLLETTLAADAWGVEASALTRGETELQWAYLIGGSGSSLMVLALLYKARRRWTRLCRSRVYAWCVWGLALAAGGTALAAFWQAVAGEGERTQTYLFSLAGHFVLLALALPVVGAGCRKSCLPCEP